MRCYTLTIPPTNTRFYHHVPTSPNPLSLRPIFTYPTRIRFGSLRTKASINGGHVVSEEASQLSFYELLGIPLSGSLMEIKQAYKQLARKYHPDVSPPGRVEEYTKRFILVQEAYETLSDPRLKAMYDRDMARGIHLAFNARTRYHDDDDLQVVEQKSQWKSRWQSQLFEMKRRSESKNGGGNMSWAARMRQQRDQSEEEL
ncbi:putative DnaJ domain-containing protein [Lupinus albus]|uniref:Putative DnaJ domain-containing protein n=1 Tax=Lupinus albus TaxID=3870 RepID=A0A6A4Q961_LUPAL|nr:putative DnaJ domain-containing protein [Lupinus albus]